mgnify:CR=1 FL=1
MAEERDPLLEPGALERELRRRSRQPAPYQSKTEKEQRLEELRSQAQQRARGERGMASSPEEEEAKELAEELRRPRVPLPSERMQSEIRDFTDNPSYRPLPSRFTGALLGSVTGGPARAATQAAIEARQRPAEAEIFETIVGSGREMYGHPEPPVGGGFTQRGTLGKSPHPTFLRNYKNFYNDFSKDMQEGTLFPRDADLLEFVSDLDRLQSSLLEKFKKSATLEIGRGTPLYQKFPFIRQIPATQMLAAYEEGNTERFNQFVRELARVQALKQAIGDYGQVFGLEREEASRVRDQSEQTRKRAKDRKEFSP